MDTPDTTTYMIAGYVVIFGGILLYSAVLAWRFKRLKEEEKMLEPDRPEA